MRLITAVAIALLVLPAPLLAQKAFEGQVTMMMPVAGQTHSADMFVKGNRVRTDLTMGGMSMYTILDNDAKQMFMVIPAQKMVMHQSLDLDQLNAGAPEPKITRTGESAEVAGMKCDIVVVDDGNGNSAELCGARGMGSFAGGTSQKGQPAWARELDDFFTLRVRDPASGKVIMEVTSVTPGPVDDSKFVVPADYQSMEMPSAP